jgi:hypothetical protein
MAGVKPTRIDREGFPLPDEVSIDGDYTGDDVDWDAAPGMGGQDQWKQPVRAATTANVTISTALNNADTLDGVTLATGDRVLVKDQSTASQNGIYIVGATPARAADMDDDVEVLGAVVYVVAGTVNSGTVWTVTNTAATVVDTDAITWAALEEPGLAGHLADAADAHDASAVSVLDTAANFTGTDVEAVLAELQDNIDAVGGILSNYAATTDPAVSDDSGDGYAIGSRWINTTTDEEFVATDVSVGAAVWLSTTDAGGSGAVATDTIWDAKGDLAGGTGANTAARLAVGTNGYVLTADSAETTGMKWAASGGGSVDWYANVDESGTSFANFTAASGTWSSNGTEIIQTDTGGAWRRAKFNTAFPEGYPWIMEAEMQVITSGGRAGLGLADTASGGSGLSVHLIQGTGVRVDVDAVTTLQTYTQTINTSTWYKLRVVHGNSFISLYLDGTLIGSTSLIRGGGNWDVDMEYFTLLSYAASAKWRNVKAWTLSTGAPA